MSLELKPLIAKLNPISRRAFEGAADFCVKQTHFSVELEHLLTKLLDIPDSDFVTLLNYYEVPLPTFRAELVRGVEKLKRGSTRTPSMSPYILALLREAWLISSLRLDGNLIRSGAMTLAILDHDAIRGSIIETLPSLLKIPREALRQDFIELLKHSPEAALQGPREDRHDDGEGGIVTTPTPALDQYTIDLIDEARRGRIDPVEGRDNEIRQLIDILTRRRQNNPILTGDAGVGKTAVVEGFARRIFQKDVPPELCNVSVRILDLGLLQAGAGVKGEFENRLKSVIDEVKSSLQPIILFIDEAHTLIGAGGQAGQGDAANLLKPALARGELRTIAATTWSEYKAHIEKDPALTRRFQVVSVAEPSEENAVIMLRTTVANLEKHHRVRILDEAVRDAVRLSHRYISGRQLPDKAISVLDTACARVTIAQNSTPPVLEAALRRLTRLQEEQRLLEREQIAGADHQARLAEISAERERLEQVRDDLQTRWDGERQAVQRVRELETRLETRPDDQADRAEFAQLQEDLEQAKAELREHQGKDPMVPAWVDGRIVAEVISNWTGIPAGKMLTDEIDTILRLKQKMEQRIVGQNHALTTIARRIQTYRAGLDDPAKPVGVFMLVGPSGVGKTETAVTLAELMYGGEHNMITVNMSEYQEAHTVSSLKGAPPGYVGYGKGGVLTEAVRRNPYSVVLLDEVEKAHPDVTELFFQVFDKGTMEDGEGVSVDFRNTILLLTSNITSETIRHQFEAAFPDEPDLETLRQAIRPELLRHFKAAFLGRLVIVPYFPLGDEEIHRIVQLKLERIQQRFLENHKARLTYDENLLTAIVRRCTETQSGARAIDHILTDTLLPMLSVEILQHAAGDRSFSAVHLRYDDGQFRYEFQGVSPTEEIAGETMPHDDKAGTGSLPGELDSLLDWSKTS